MKTILTLTALFTLTLISNAQTTTIDFEDKSLSPNSFYNGSDLAGGFTSGGAFFNNSYSPTFGAWSGWSYANIKDVTTPGFTNQYASYALPTGGGVGNTGNYGVAFNFSAGDARITLPLSTNTLSVSITNTTYAALSMRDGDSFAKKFGGVTGNDPDFFLLTIQGRDSSNTITGTVPFYLADYRFSNNALDYIVSQWTSIDLSGLPGTTTSLTFDLTSTDVGTFGMNTPSYFALDNLVLAVPEPGSLTLVGCTIVLSGSGWWAYRRKYSQKDCATPSYPH